MKCYAIVIDGNGEISGNKIYTAKALALAVIAEHGCTLDTLNNVRDNGTIVARLVTLSLVAE